MLIANITIGIRELTERFLYPGQKTVCGYHIYVSVSMGKWCVRIATTYIFVLKGIPVIVKENDNTTVHCPAQLRGTRN